MKQIYRIMYAVVMITTAFLILTPVNTQYEPEIIHPKKSLPKNNNVEKQKEEIILSYKKIDAVINSNNQVINILELKNNNNIYDVVPILSQDSIFGFETTSSMAKRKNADAAINGGFFYPYGQPSGVIITNGSLWRTPIDKSNRKLFIQDDKGRYHIKAVSVESYIQLGDRIFSIDGVNRLPEDNEIILYTRLFGRSNRLNGKLNYSIKTKDNYITSYRMSKTEMNIDSNEYVLSATGTKMDRLKEFYYANKDNTNRIKLKYIVNGFNDSIKNAFEGGFRVIKNKKVVIEKNEPWVGLTTNREPRTVVGLKNNGNLVLLTVDGRQPGYSIGLSGKELGAYLLKYGIKDALMLDGGASTTMVVKDKIVNKPSYRNEERMVGGSICIVKR